MMAEADIGIEISRRRVLPNESLHPTASGGG